MSIWLQQTTVNGCLILLKDGMFYGGYNPGTDVELPAEDSECVLVLYMWIQAD